jgi:hypothetical protein
MAQMLNLIGSTTIGGVVLLMILLLNGNMVNTASVQTMNISTQENLTTLVGMIEYDFAKMGYRVSDSLKIRAADSSRIVFNADIDNNGGVDSISYALASVLNAATQNPRDRILYRTLNNGTSTPIDLGVTRFRLWYYDSLGNITTWRSKMRAVRLAIGLESIWSLDTIYTGACWERTIKPKNLR